MKFLITSVRTGDTEIFAVTPETGDAINLSRSPASEDRYPCWSTDAKHVAFTSNRDDGHYNLFVMDADGANVRQFTHGEAVSYMPCWVGDRIVFGLHGERPEIASINDDGSNLQILGPGHDPCLSPDGQRIAFTGETPGGVAVWVMKADGTDRRKLTEANPWGAVFPSWSPDGQKIVYAEKVGETLELFTIGADGSNPTQLTHLKAIATPPAWSPDGKWISFRLTDERYWSDKKRVEEVYAQRPSDKRPVWVIHPDGSDAHVIECLRFQCAMDGSRAAWRP